MNGAKRAAARWLIVVLAGSCLGESRVLTGQGTAGDWQSDAPGVEHKITIEDLPPDYATPKALMTAANSVTSPNAIHRKKMRLPICMPTTPRDPRLGAVSGRLRHDTDDRRTRRESDQQPSQEIEQERFDIHRESLF